MVDWIGHSDPPCAVHVEVLRLLFRRSLAAFGPSLISAVGAGSGPLVHHWSKSALGLDQEHPLS